MNILYNKLKEYTLDDAIYIEESDRQFIALKKLYKNIKEKDLYLSLIIVNSIICYQLSGKGEDYWEEFSEYFINKDISRENIILEIGKFVKQSKNNRRFIETKIKRIEKLNGFLKLFIGKEDFFYNSMLELRDLLAKNMNQKNTAKTIVFAVKMFSYGARNIYNLVFSPKEIVVPIDSRLKALFEKYKGKYNDISKFYLDLSMKLNIPELHLDAIIWVNYKELIK